MRTKVCGIRNYEDAMTAIRAGADALGFLVGITHLAEDKISAEEAAQIIAKLPPFISTVMVTHLTDKEQIVETARFLKVNTVQIHDYIPPQDVAYVRENLPGCKIIKAVHIINEAAAMEMMHSFESVCDALLLDSRTKDRLGGTGIVCDWDVSRKIVAECAIPVILAGGLNHENVYDAVLKVRPFGVDANSGLETPDGWKDPVKIRNYASNARRAELQIQD